jgi:acyl carrier protein
MNDVRERVSRCFSVVFPELNGDQFTAASVETIKEWDSVATVTLVALLEEEFGIQFDLDAIDHFTSFRGVLDYLNARTAQ